MKRKAHFSKAFKLSSFLLSISALMMLLSLRGRTELCDYASMRVRELLAFINYPMRYALFEGIIVFSPIIVFAVCRTSLACLSSVGGKKLFFTRLFSSVFIILSIYIFTVGIPSVSKPHENLSLENLTDEDYFEAAEALVEIAKNAELKQESSDGTQFDYSHLPIYKLKNEAVFLPKIKESALPLLWSSLGINGEYFFLTGEIMINSHLPEYMKPFIAAHEIAHYIGADSEAYANFYASVITLSSEAPEAVVSGAISSLEYLLSDIYIKDSEKYYSILSTLSEHTKAALSEGRAYRERFAGNRASKFAESLNSMHTELYGEKEKRSYSALSALLADYFKNNRNIEFRI